MFLCFWLQISCHGWHEELPSERFTSEHFAFLRQFLFNFCFCDRTKFNNQFKKNDPECAWVTKWKVLTHKNNYQLTAIIFLTSHKKRIKRNKLWSIPTVRKAHDTTRLKSSFEWLFMSHVTWSSPRTKLLLKNLNQTWTSSPWRNLNVYSSRTNGNPVKTMIRDGGKPVLAALESNSQLIQKPNRDVEQIQFVSTIKSHQVIFSDWDF